MVWVWLVPPPTYHPCKQYGVVNVCSVQSYSPSLCSEIVSLWELLVISVSPVVWFVILSIEKFEQVIVLAAQELMHCLFGLYVCSNLERSEP